MLQKTIINPNKVEHQKIIGIAPVKEQYFFIGVCSNIQTIHVDLFNRHTQCIFSLGTPPPDPRKYICLPRFTTVLYLLHIGLSSQLLSTIVNNSRNKTLKRFLVKKSHSSRLARSIP